MVIPPAAAVAGIEIELDAEVEEALDGREEEAEAAEVEEDDIVYELWA